MAGVDLRTAAELMGPSSIQMTMRYAHLAPQHNRAAVDRLVPVSEPHRAAKISARIAKRGNKRVNESVTSQKQFLERAQKIEMAHLTTMLYNQWPRSSGG